MRVLAIRGRNLASLEGEFSIDFTEEPLASAGIFAISGPTGRENPRCWMPCASPFSPVRRERSWRRRITCG